MMKMNVFQFKDIMKGFYDGPHATPDPSEEGPVFLGIKNIYDDGGIDFSEIRHISEKEYPKWTKRVTPQKDDLVFSYEATLHKYALIPENFEGCLGRRMALIRVNKSMVSAKYLYYHFLSPYWKSFVETIKISGSTVDRISIAEFPNYKIPLPPIHLQNEIASILSAYDDLIENNKQRIKLLEEMAEEIYKEWFVRLRFPGHETARFFNHSGKEVSSVTYGAIPEGWSYSFLRNHLKIFRGKSYSSIELRDNEGLPMLNLKNINRNGGFRRDGLKYFEGKFAKHHLTYSGDLILAITDMTQNRELVGRVAIIPEMGINEFIISMDLIKIVPIHLPKIFLYSFFRYSGIGLKLAEFANGANVLHLTPDLIYLEKAKLPNLELAMKFEEFSKPIINEIDVLENKNQLLQQTRDLLLPRLISGKLSVEHLVEPNPEG